MIFLGIILAVVGLFGGMIIMSASYDFQGLLLGLVVAVVGVGLGVMCVRTDINSKNAKFEQAVVSKQYETSVTMVNGVYKDKIVSNEDRQYDLDLKYSEIKELPELKPNDVVKITYITGTYKGRFIISVEKIK